MLYLSANAELPIPMAESRAVASTRVVRSDDREHAHLQIHVFDWRRGVPGHHGVGVSADVIRDLRATGKASITLDGKLGELANLLSGLLQSMSGPPSAQPSETYPSAAGIIHVVEPKPCCSGTGQRCAGVAARLARQGSSASAGRLVHLTI
jgi:hypothetical protein